MNSFCLVKYSVFLIELIHIMIMVVDLFQNQNISMAIALPLIRSTGQIPPAPRWRERSLLESLVDLCPAGKSTAYSQSARLAQKNGQRQRPKVITLHNPPYRHLNSFKVKIVPKSITARLIYFLISLKNG